MIWMTQATPCVLSREGGVDLLCCDGAFDDLTAGGKPAFSKDNGRPGGGGGSNTSTSPVLH